MDAFCKSFEITAIGFRFANDLAFNVRKDNKLDVYQFNFLHSSKRKFVNSLEFKRKRKRICIDFRGKWPRYHCRHSLAGLAVHYALRFCFDQSRARLTPGTEKPCR